uniref:Uncharacterized protein n=1 Tax=Paramormyrops kingsleyae TaxID=1676925 RepID=A0A3B3S538_9TELE
MYTTGSSPACRTARWIPPACRAARWIPPACRAARRIPPACRALEWPPWCRCRSSTGCVAAPSSASGPRSCSAPARLDCTALHARRALTSTEHAHAVSHRL